MSFVDRWGGIKRQRIQVDIAELRKQEAYETLKIQIAHSDGGFVDKDFFKGMKKDDKAAILMVHFGTTFDDTRALTIDRINEKVKKEFKNVDVKEAYTSRIIMRRLKWRNLIIRLNNLPTYSYFDIKCMDLKN